MDIIESYLKLRLLADCIDTKAQEKPACGLSLVNVPPPSSPLYEPFHQLLELMRADLDAVKTPFRCFNVTYGLLSRRSADPAWERVSFSLSCRGCVIHTELHHKPPLGPETLLMVCEPQMSLERNEYRLQEMLPLRRFIENEILPAVCAELSDSQLIYPSSPMLSPPRLVH